MQIVIEIPESVKQAFDEATEGDIYGCYYDYNSIIGRAIKNGVPTEPCDDAISRQAAINLMRGMNRWCVMSEDGMFNNYGFLYDDVMFVLDRLPSVTPKQKMGYWEEHNDDHYDWVECHDCGYGSECEITSEHGVRFNFCPNCGAKMVEPRESEGE